jgi:tetratricopeptide (TPR) repeat protein
VRNWKNCREILQAPSKEYKKSPEDVEKIINYGRATANLWRYHEAIEVFSRGLELFPENAMLYRHRGHRFISIRDFDRAIDDLTVASLLEDSDFDIWYHLALARYLKGNFEAAEQAWLKCLGVAQGDDSIIAASNWLYITLRRERKASEADLVLTRINENMEVVENGSYHALLLFYKGLRTEDQLQKLASESEPEKATIYYGLGCWHLYNDDPTKAGDYFRECITGDYWPAFGYISAEVELARAGEK